MIGKILGERYEILSRLGGGGMALVYKGRDIRLNRLITIKILRPEYTSDSDFVRRFNREAQSVACLSHPNIVSIYDGGQEGEIYYLVMEYVQGENLKDLISREGALPIEQALDITSQVCSALTHAHGHKIVHRDIKPHNILISANGVAKLTDFGIALETGTSTLSNPDTVLGSVHYISPEQAKGKEAIVASDIYSLGIVLYEMLTGKLPFTGDSPIAIALAQVQNSPILPSRLNPNIPSGLERLILQALAKNPEERFSSAKEFATRIKYFSQISNLPAEDKDNLEEETRVLTPMPEENHETMEFSKTDYHNQGTATFRSGDWGSRGSGFGEHQYKSGWDKPKDSGRSNEPAVIKGPTANYPAGGTVSKEKKGNWFIKVLVALIILTIVAGAVIFLKAVLSEGVVNKGNSLEVVLPSWKGQSSSEAIAFLKANELVYEISEDYNDEIAQGEVISQTPGAGTYVAKGEKITLVVSLGEFPVSVPNLTNKTTTEAAEELAKLGLKLEEGAWEDYSETVTKGNIFYQEPSSGTELTKGETVTVYLSKGPQEKVTVPSFVGMTWEQAQAQAAEKGLKVSGNQNTDTKVSKQSPVAGSSVIPGSSVALTFAAQEVDEETPEQTEGEKENNPDANANPNSNNHSTTSSAKSASVRVNAPSDLEAPTAMNAYLYDDQYSGKLIYTYQMGVSDYVVFNMSYWGTARVEIYLGDSLYETQEFK